MKIFPSLLALTLSFSPSFAQSVKVGDLTIEKAWARETPKGAEVGAGYLTIRNDGPTADRLAGLSVDFAKVQMHEMKMSNGVMQMRELTDGVEIPAHGVVTFAPGGNHLMFVGLKAPLVKGQIAQATLTFTHAGSIIVEMPIQRTGASSPDGATTP